MRCLILQTIVVKSVLPKDCEHEVVPTNILLDIAGSDIQKRKRNFKESKFFNKERFV